MNDSARPQRMSTRSRERSGSHRPTPLPTPSTSLSPPWQWPLDLASYDRAAELSPAERTELAHLLAPGADLLRRRRLAILDRLVRPIQDVLVWTQAPLDKHSTVRRGATGGGAATITQRVSIWSLSPICSISILLLRWVSSSGR